MAVRVHSIDPEGRTSTDFVLELKKRLEDSKAIKLGSGCFASVYSLPGGSVIKVGRGANTCLNPISLYDGYSDWLITTDKYRQNGMDSEFFPRVKNADIYTLGNGVCFYIVEMEQLYEWKNAPRTVQTQTLRRIDVSFASLEDLLFCAWYSHRVSTEHGRNLVAALNEVFQRRGNDLHRGNIMIRHEQDGRLVPVITDPCV